MSLSTRGQELLQEHEFMTPILKCWFNPYHKEKNPNGYINLGVAQSELVKPLLNEIISKVRKACPFSENTFGYGDFNGSAKLKLALRDFFAKYLFLCEADQLDFNNFTVNAGCNVLLETIGFILCNPGDYILIDAPYYHALDMDFGRRFNVLLDRVPLLLGSEKHSEKNTSNQKLVYHMNVDGLRERLIKNPKISCILLVNPHNPTGKLYTDEELKQLLELSLEFNVHIVADEVYALSVLNPEKKFKSIYHFVLQESDSEKRARLENLVHIIYSASKDWGLNGFRVGYLYSQNPQVNMALASISDMNALSRDTILLMENFFTEKEMIDHFIVQNCNMLQKYYERAIKIFDEYPDLIEYVEADFGMFIYFNIKSDKSQEEIFNFIMDEAHVMLAQGKYCHDPRQRWYRCCIACMPTLDDLEFALNRLIDAVKKLQ